MMISALTGGIWKASHFREPTKTSSTTMIFIARTQIAPTARICEQQRSNGRKHKKKSAKASFRRGQWWDEPGEVGKCCHALSALKMLKRFDACIVLKAE